jgi:DnaJ-class molecular chaperone
MPSNHEIVFERESEQQPGITPGNVVFKLQQKPHPRFKRNRDDLHHDMHITLKEALLGFEKTVKQLDGTDVVVEQKDRVSRPFQVLLLKEEGMPKHNFPSESGDMHVKLHIDMPRKLTSAQKKLVEELLG